MNTRLIIDGDIFLYRASFGAESEVCWDSSKDFWTLYGDLNEAKSSFNEQVQKVQETTGVDDVLICFSGRDIFRKDFFPEYKANRSGKRKPVLLAPLREAITAKYSCLTIQHLEADDLLGIVATEGDIMCSSDKDLMTVPGLHYNPAQSERGVIQVTPHEAVYTHFIQTLCGDTADNFKGCPGVGVMTAKRKMLVAPPSEMWSTVVSLFEDAGLTPEDALTQARLSYILRGGDYDFVTGNINLWTPERYNEYDRTATTA